MDVRYFLDPDTDEPHIYDHGVTEEEVENMYCGIRAKIGRAAMTRDMLWAKRRPDDICA